MKALITGGSGFIGKALCSRLLNMGWTFDNIDIKRGKDICRDPLFGSYDVVFHLAALRSVTESEKISSEYFHNNVYGTYRVLKENPKARIINISSCAAENPESAYGMTKFLTEQMGKLHDKCVSLRVFNPFGPGNLCNDLVIPIFATAMSKGKTITFHGDGSQVRDYIYIDDVISEIMHYALDSTTGVWDVGYCKGVSVQELFDAMAPHFDYKMSPIYGQRRKGDKQRCVAMNPLHVKPIGFDKGLAITLESYK
jgi:UDP-glucose 4-epimerase